MITYARHHRVELDRSDVRVSYIIEMHKMFVWSTEIQFQQFVEKCITGLREQFIADSLKKAG